MKRISIGEAFRQMRPSAYGIMLLVLCVFVSMVEGIDIQVMALAAPLVTKTWGLELSATGMLLSASVVGQVVGSLVFAPLGDRWGRRPAILIALVVAAVTTAAGAFAPDYTTLLATRCIAGLALGLALPNTTTIAMEFVPHHWRTFAVVTVSCGIPIGVTTGALVVSRLLATQGSAAAFYVGGVSTFIAFLLCAMFLPESPVILAGRPSDQRPLRRLLGRLGCPIEEDIRIEADQIEPAPSRAGALLARDRRAITILLWSLAFTTMLVVYFFMMWLPSLVVSRGAAAPIAAISQSILSGSGVLGGLALAMVMTRRGPLVALTICHVLIIAAAMTLAGVRGADTGFYANIAVLGAVMGGSHFCLNAMVSQFYPGAIRATGTGYVAAAGRLGAMLAPILGGVVMARLATPSAAFGVASIPAAISLVVLFLLRGRRLSGATPAGNQAPPTADPHKGECHAG